MTMIRPGSQPNLTVRSTALPDVTDHRPLRSVRHRAINLPSVCYIAGLNPRQMSPEAPNPEGPQKTAADCGVDVTPRLKTLRVAEPPKRLAGIKVADVGELVAKLKALGAAA